MTLFVQTKADRNKDKQALKARYAKQKQEMVGVSQEAGHNDEKK